MGSVKCDKTPVLIDWDFAERQSFVKDYFLWGLENVKEKVKEFVRCSLGKLGDEDNKRYKKWAKFVENELIGSRTQVKTLEKLRTQSAASSLQKRKREEPAASSETEKKTRINKDPLESTLCSVL
eukprot:GHVR01051845.1.p2 GENE.GHVR01051845.1~~GHVR01051845.1.p2  ORF type:complete len:125 (+),score=21.64 GHVR01051845.1:267-641(+)